MCLTAVLRCVQNLQNSKVRRRRLAENHTQGQPDTPRTVTPPPRTAALSTGGSADAQWKQKVGGRRGRGRRGRRYGIVGRNVGRWGGGGGKVRARECRLFSSVDTALRAGCEAYRVEEREVEEGVCGAWKWREKKRNAGEEDNGNTKDQEGCRKEQQHR